MPSPGAQQIIDELDRLAAALAEEIRPLTTEQEIRAAQARYLGKKGRASELMKALGKLPAEERPAPPHHREVRALSAARARTCCEHRCRVHSCEIQ